jgi:hypothetical protein
MFLISSFIFSCVSNILIVVILYDFYLLPSYICYIAIGDLGSNGIDIVPDWRWAVGFASQ